MTLINELMNVVLPPLHLCLTTKSRYHCVRATLYICKYYIKSATKTWGCLVLLISMLPLPPRFADLKREIANSYPDFEKRVTKAWAEIIDQLNKRTEEIAKEGSEVRRLFSRAKFHALTDASTFHKSSFRNFRALERKT